MAVPIDFDQCNSKWLGEGDAGDLPVYDNDDGLKISKWQLSEEEKSNIQESGIIWLYTWANSHPPVSLTAEYPFEEE